MNIIRVNYFFQVDEWIMGVGFIIWHDTCNNDNFVFVTFHVCSTKFIILVVIFSMLLLRCFGVALASFFWILVFSNCVEPVWTAILWNPGRDQIIFSSSRYLYEYNFSSKLEARSFHEENLSNFLLKYPILTKSNCLIFEKSRLPTNKLVIGSEIQ